MHDEARLAARNAKAGFAALVALLFLSGGLTVYDYFFRWSKMPEVYRAFDGQAVELANYLIGPESNANLIIPFYLYTHASIRYLLHDNFTESVFLPEEVAAGLQQQVWLYQVYYNFCRRATRSLETGWKAGGRAARP